MPYAVRESLQKDISEILNMKVIHECEVGSRSDYAYPVVVVAKRDESDSVCIDYRLMNKIKKINPEPMVTINDLFFKTANDRYFTRFDLSKGCWQMSVAEKDIKKTAFITPYGVYEFLKCALKW